MIAIDGSLGEGGGQVLRTSLSLSLLTGKPFRIRNIRARRKRPGLLRQHLTAVRAGAEISQATVQGAAIDSQELTIAPGAVRPGKYRFAVGTAGSATLVLQTVLPALMIANGPSYLRLEGGTHNPWAPPFDFLDKAFLPLLRRMAPASQAPLVEITLQQPGFYPAGGGIFHVRIEPQAQLRRLDVTNRGPIVHQRASAIVSRLPLAIAQRELRAIQDHFAWPDDCMSAASVDSPGPGNCVSIEIESEHVTEVFTGFGQKGVPAEQVAAGVIKQTRRYLASGVPVGEHLADQLLIPMALAGGGSFVTLPPSTHTMTNIETLKRFLDVDVHTEQMSEETWQVAIQAR